jgi:hypothetical protein
MTLTIDLTPEETRRVHTAQEIGIDVTAIMRGVIAGLPEAPQVSEDRTLALLSQWREEDASGDPEELERRDAEAHELMQNLDAHRLTLPIPEV